jgi:outer membrane protein TolC
MRFRQGSTFFILLLITVFGRAQTKQPTKYEFSIQQCVDYAGKNNVQVKNALLDYQIQEQTNRGITAAAYPQINGSASATHYPNVPVQSFPNFIAAATYGVLASEGVKKGDGTPVVPPADFGFVQAAFGTKWIASGGVSLSQILFDGQVFVGLQARRTSLEYQQNNIDVALENIRANIYKVYYQLVVSKTQVEQIDANIARAEKLLNDTRALYRNGFAEKLDEDKASVQLANLQTEKLTAQNAINNGYLGLKLLIGMPAQDTVILTDSITEDKIKEDMLVEPTYKYTDRLDYQLLESVSKLNAYNVKRYKFMYLPTVNLTAGYTKNAQRNTFNFIGRGDWFTSSYIGLNINIPIFDGFLKASNVRKAQLELEQARNQIENLKITIDNSVTQAINNNKNALTRLEFQKRNMQLAEQVYNQAKKKYEVGTGSSTEITNAQTDLRIAQSNYISALYDAIIAKVDYTKAIGKL